MTDMNILTAKTLQTIDDVNAAPWADIEGRDTIALSIGMLRTLAISRPKPAIYPTVWRGDQLVAGTVAYFLSAATSPSRWMRLDMLMRDAMEGGGATPPAGLEGMIMPTLSVGAHASVTERMLIRPELLGEGRRAAIATLLDSSIELARQEGCASVCLPYVDPADGDVVRELAARGFARFPSMWSCSIEVSWSSFDDYLQSVPSRRRVRIHRERRAVEESGLVIMEEPLTEELARESEVLKGNIDAKYHGEEARQPLTEISYSLVLARECPDKTFAVTARDADGTLRGQRRGHVCGRNPGLGDVGRRLRGVWQTAALL